MRERVVAIVGIVVGAGSSLDAARSRRRRRRRRRWCASRRCARATSSRSANGWPRSTARPTPRSARRSPATSRRSTTRRAAPSSNGTLLFRLDQRPFVAAVEKARGDLENAVAQLEQGQGGRRPLHAARRRARALQGAARRRARLPSAPAPPTSQAMQGRARHRQAQPRVGRRALAHRRPGRHRADARRQRWSTPTACSPSSPTLDPIRASVNISEREYLTLAERLNHVNEPRYANARITRAHPHRRARASLSGAARHRQPADRSLDGHAAGAGALPQPRQHPAPRAVRQGARALGRAGSRRAGARARGAGAAGAPSGRRPRRRRARADAHRQARAAARSLVRRRERAASRASTIIVEGLQNVQPGAKVNAQAGGASRRRGGGRAALRAGAVTCPPSSCGGRSWPSSSASSSSSPAWWR